MVKGHGLTGIRQRNSYTEKQSHIFLEKHLYMMCSVLLNFNLKILIMFKFDIQLRQHVAY